MATEEHPPPPSPAGGPRLEHVDVLRSIESRVLWLAASIVHHANRRRPNATGVKVGGHQASSASMASIMTALWFSALRGPDRVSVKPHASPVLHAINYLLGDLEAGRLERLRDFGGLQSYPSRTKDPDRIDYSTGSVGIGATATIWGALAHRYVAGHFDVPVGGRQVALVGDAELDEGAVWEAVVDPMVPGLGEVLWVVDVNRQSLDRVVPDIQVTKLARMFEAAGWGVATVKYGRLLRELFGRPGGEDLRRRIDRMGNEEYQRLLRSDPAELRERLPGTGRGARAVRELVAGLEDAEVHAAVRDLGGHDLADLLASFRAADAAADRPSVVLAYTIKGWRLPIEGHPSNHSALLTEAEWRALGGTLGADPEDPWRRFDPGSAEALLCAAAAERLARPERPAAPPASVPAALGRRHAGSLSTQQTLGRCLTDLAHEAPETAARVVTVSPDVASSTNLGGWINRVGVWSLGDRIDWFADDSATLVRWRESDHGRHVELGIAETSLVGLLGELGATYATQGEPLIPIGTIYDPFVARALEPWTFGIYAGGQSILVGTPSGITLAPEGGAHQSVTTPSIGVAQPGVVAWEPAFAQDLEWCLLHAMAQLGRRGGESAYLRLSTRPLDQALAGTPEDGEALEARRRDVVGGGYLLRRSERPPAVTLAGMGAVMPEVAAAAEILAGGGIAADVICVTSADLLFRAWRAPEPGGILDRVLPAGRAAPLVTVLDGHPSALAFLGGVRRVPSAALGVDAFGQSGDLDQLYAHYGLDADAIVDAALDLLDG